MRAVSRTNPLTHIYFVAGDIFGQTTGGTLCDREIFVALQDIAPCELVLCPLSGLRWLRSPILRGLIANIRVAFTRFEPGSLIVFDNGNYRDIFLAVWWWKLLKGHRLLGIVFHFDFHLAARPWTRWLRKAQETALVRSMEYVLTISLSSQEDIIRMGIPPDRIAIFEVSRQLKPLSMLPKRDTEKNTIVFFFIATIEPRKALPDVFEALQRYGGTKNLVFRCAGYLDHESDYGKQLLSQARKTTGVEIRFLGRLPKEEVTKEFLSADAFLFPSRWEGYGMAIEEAMSFGLPVVSCRIGSIPEVVTDGHDGWLVTPGDIAALTSAITECADNAAERIRRGRHALESARRLHKHTDWKALLPQILSTIVGSTTSNSKA